MLREQTIDLICRFNNSAEYEHLFIGMSQEDFGPTELETIQPTNNKIWSTYCQETEESFIFDKETMAVIMVVDGRIKLK